MHERGGHVECRQDNEEVGQDLVHFLEAVRERLIGDPGRRNRRQAEERQRMTSRELQCDPEQRNQHQQPVERVMHHPGYRIGPLDQPSAEFGRRAFGRRIGDAPRYPQERDHQDGQSDPDVNQ